MSLTRRVVLAAPLLAALTLPALAQSVAGIDDVHASADYRQRLAVVYARRALVKAHERALQGRA